MSTPVLQLHNLAEMMTDAAKRADDPSLRFHNETDAVMYGKMIQLQCLAESVWMGAEFAEGEESLLREANERMDRAWKRIADAVFPSSEPN